MVAAAMAQETVCALRREIAKLEGRASMPSPSPAVPGCLALPEAVALRRDGRICGEPAVSTGAPGLDRALGGGVPDAALIELHAAQTRDAAAASGFGMALAGLRLSPASERAPILWIATVDTLRETGQPYLGGLRGLLGAMPGRLLLARARRLGDALWMAEEALGISGLSTVILEVHGAAVKLDLTATRRLDARARQHRRLAVLLRHGEAAEPLPTAARLRLLVGPAPASPRRILSGQLAGSIGPPAFLVAVSKSRTAPLSPLLLEWNPHERRFIERGSEDTSEDSGAVVPVSRHGADLPQAAGTVLALGRTAAAARTLGKEREQAPDQSSRRAG